MEDILDVILSEEIVEEEQLNDWEGDEVITTQDLGWDFPFHMISVE